MDDKVIETLTDTIYELVRIRMPKYDRKFVRMAVLRAMEEAQETNRVFGLPRSVVADSLMSHVTGWAYQAYETTDEIETLDIGVAVSAAISKAINPEHDLTGDIEMLRLFRRTD